MSVKYVGKLRVWLVVSKGTIVGMGATLREALVNAGRRDLW